MMLFFKIFNIFSCFNLFI